MKRSDVRPLCVLVAVLCLLGPRAAQATIDADLDGVGVINATGTQDLTVRNPERKTLKIRRAEDFIIFQGGQDTRRTVNTSESSAEKHLVANVEIPEAGDLAYRVNGVYVGSGTGPSRAWRADYNSGARRLVLHVNTPSPDDNYVGMLGEAVKTAELLVYIANATPTAEGYGVDVSDRPGGGEVGFPSGDDCVLAKIGDVDWRVLPLSGRAPGQTIIQALATGVTTGTTDAVVTDIAVTFSPTSLRTGYTLPLDTCTIRTPVTATVTPSEAIGDIVLKPILSVGGANRASIIGIATNPDIGTIDFNVRGNSRTPPSEPNGDSYIEARYRGALVGRVPVIVIVPWSLQTQSTPGFVNVTGQNQGANRTTSPAYTPQLPPGIFHLWTYYVVWQTITVRDQFGAPLDAMYQGSPVSELRGTLTINQNITAQGTYSDPVGVTADRPQPPPNDVPAADVPAWLAAPRRPIPVGSHVQNVEVQVGGHPMHPGVRGRVVTSADNPPRIRIQWQ